MRKLSSNIIKLAVLTSFTACAVGPDYEQPQAKLPVEFQAVKAQVAESAAPQVDWWRSFNDPTLDKLIAQAVDNNFSIDRALANLRQARAVETEAFLDLLPKTTGVASYTKSHTPFVFGGGDRATTSTSEDIVEYELYQTGFDAAWEVDLFGQLRRLHEAREAEAEASLADLRAVLLSVLAETANNYFSLIGTQKELEVARKNADKQRETMELTKRMLELGQVTSLDHVRAEALYHSTISRIPEIEARKQALLVGLGILLGKDLESISQEFALQNVFPQYTGAVQVGNPEELLRRRPDVRSAERKLASENALIGAAIAYYFPKVNLFGSIGFQVPHSSDLGNSGTDYYSYGPKITWELLNFNSIRQKVAIQDAATEAALANYEETVLRALGDVETNVSQFARNREAKLSMDQAARASAEASRLAEEQFRLGAIDFLAVLDAQRQALEYESQQAELETRCFSSLIGLYKALGGGWEEFDVVEVKE